MHFILFFLLHPVLLRRWNFISNGLIFLMIIAPTSHPRHLRRSLTKSKELFISSLYDICSFYGIRIYFHAFSTRWWCSRACFYESSKINRIADVFFSKREIYLKRRKWSKIFLFFFFRRLAYVWAIWQVFWWISENFFQFILVFMRGLSAGFGWPLNNLDREAKIWDSQTDQKLFLIVYIQRVFFEIVQFFSSWKIFQVFSQFHFIPLK